MLNYKERVLVREILRRALRSEKGREFIAELLGREGIQVAESLLKGMEE
jgi:hypothetical protein